MKGKYIILRELMDSRGGRTRSGTFGAFPFESGAAAEPNVRIEIEDINFETDSSKLLLLQKDPTVLGYAKEIPLRLVEPLQSEAPAAVPAASVTWGISAVRADSSAYSGAGVKVAVLDTGIDSSHLAFSGMNIVEKDFTGTGNGDTHGHGTHCAGTIAGQDVGGLRIGVARGIDSLLVGKVLGGSGGGSLNLINAMHWAVNEGAHVISMSLGFDFPGYVNELVQDNWPVDLATSQALQDYRANVALFDSMADTIEKRALFGTPTLIVAASGNESRRNVHPDYVLGCAPPAVAQSVISVAALGQQPGGLEVAYFSNGGVEISGPGIDVISAKAGGGTAGMSGTSMATPHVAGVASLWAEKLLNGMGLSIRPWTAAILNSATTTALSGNYSSYNVGTGLVQAP